VSLSRFIVGRVASLIGILLVLTFVIFLIQAVLPADPVAAQLGGGASRELIEEKRQELGYDQPILVQYVHYLGRILHGDLGTSLRTREPVASDIARFAPATMELALASSLLILALSLLLGMWSVLRSKGGETFRVSMIGAASAPTFFVAILLILLFYSRLDWLPASGRVSEETFVRPITSFVTIDALLEGRLEAFWDALRHLILPSIVLALGPAVAIGRVLRGALLETEAQEFVRTARSKGLTERNVIRHHGLRNSMTPTLSMAGLQVGLVLTGVVVVESIFAWPGLGLYTAQALRFSDFPAIMGVTLVFGTVYVVVNAVVDTLQVVADPRLAGSYA
jgi:peptide/nickel transport system permease protein